MHSQVEVPRGRFNTMETAEDNRAWCPPGHARDEQPGGRDDGLHEENSQDYPGCSAVAYIDTQYRKTVKAAQGKQVIVETGWPSAGQTIGAAVPGAGNAATFLKNFGTWADSRGVKYYYFEAFDELWKASREDGVGSHWGIWDQNGTLKPRMSAVLGAR